MTAEKINLEKYSQDWVKNDKGEDILKIDYKELTKVFEDHPDLVTWGKKTATTRAYIATKPETLITGHGTDKESTYQINVGDVVFDNGGDDKYVPRNDDNSPKGAQVLKDKYELVSGSLEGGDGVFRPAADPTRILVDANPDFPIRIMNRWGEGSEQDFPAGAVLKLSEDGKKVTGLNGNAFKETWSITDEKGNILDEKAQTNDISNTINSDQTEISGQPKGIDQKLDNGEKARG